MKHCKSFIDQSLVLYAMCIVQTISTFHVPLFDHLPFINNQCELKAFGRIEVKGLKALQQP